MSFRLFPGSIVALCVLLSACSSGPKKTEVLQEPAQKSAPMTKSSAKAEEPSKALIEAPLEESTSRRADSRYQSLAKAVRSGQAAAAIDEASAILGTNPNDPVALNALAMVHMRRGELGAAKLLLGRAFEKNAGTAALHNNLGVVLMIEGDQAGAMANFKKALKYDDGHAEALGNLGSIYVRGGDFIRALPLLEQSYKANRGNSAVGINYAIALRATKDLEAAKKVYEDVLSRNSKDVFALLNYATLLIDYLNKPKDGLALVYKAKFLETDNKEVIARANALEKKAKADLK